MDRITKQIQTEINSALQYKPPLPVNLGRHRHGQLVNALHGLVYGNYTAEDFRRLRVTFPDGSETKPFPLFCLTPPPPPDPTEYVLRVGLNSGRHPELDRFIEIYLFRNSEVSQWESCAEQEEEAFMRSMEFLQHSCLKNGGIIEMYQTGLEPLVLGFYRAVVESARIRQKNNILRLTIAPKIFRPASLSINYFLSKHFKYPLEPVKQKNILNRIEQVLKIVIIETGDFIGLYNDEEHITLAWLPQRPMWIEEQDYLIERFPSVKDIFVALYKKSQYPNVDCWG